MWAGGVSVCKAADPDLNCDSGQSQKVQFNNVWGSRKNSFE